MYQRVQQFEPVLGTVLEVRTVAVDEIAARGAEQRALDEIDRLESVFSIYDDTSELCRWRRGEQFTPSADLTEVLAFAAHWHMSSSGAFHPAARALADAWRNAEVAGHRPPAALLAAQVSALASLPYALVAGNVVRRGRCDHVDLNAIAKGYIADRAAEVALGTPSVASVVINIGGDLVHRGSGSLRAGIEDPLEPYDNVAPKVVIELANEALATSGATRRGFRVGDEWYGHVIDPRSGEPVDRVLSVSVVAPDAVTADAVATVAGVLGPFDGCAYVDSLDAIAVLIIDRDGVAWGNTRWADRVVSAT